MSQQSSELSMELSYNMRGRAKLEPATGPNATPKQGSPNVTHKPVNSTRVLTQLKPSRTQMGQSSDEPMIIISGAPTPPPAAERAQEKPELALSSFKAR